MRRLSSGLALALALVLTPSLAEAAYEPCAQVPFGNDTLIPAHGATDVPRDTMLWIGDGIVEPWEEITLVEVLAGVETPVIRSLQGWIFDVRGSVRVFNSPVVLRANTIHRIYTCFGSDWCREQLGEFQTGTTLDAPAPAVPQVSEFTAGSLKEDAFIELVLDQGGLVVASDPDVDFDPMAFNNRVGLVIAAPGGEFTMSETCETWPLPKTGGQLRFGVYDLSGNFSGWSEPQSFEVPYYSCSLAPDPAAGLLSLPLLLLRRRRRPR